MVSDVPDGMQGMVDSLKEQLSLRDPAQRQPSEGCAVRALPAPRSAPEPLIPGSLPETALPRRVRERMCILIDSSSEASLPYRHLALSELVCILQGGSLRQLACDFKSY